MSWTRDEYLKKGNGKSHPVEAQDPRDYYRILIRDSVAAEHVTANEYWDRFLALVSGAHGKALHLFEQDRGILGSPTVVNHEQIMQVKLSMAKLDGMVAALNWVMELPKALIDAALPAKEMLRKLETQMETQQEERKPS